MRQICRTTPCLARHGAGDTRSCLVAVDGLRTLAGQRQNPSPSTKAPAMPIRITDIREITKPISSPIRNAYIDFSKMTTSLVAVVTDVKRDGRPVVGYGFNS